MTTPESVRTAVLNRSSIQPGIPWPRHSWAARFQSMSEQLGNLPDVIGRDEVKLHAQRSVEGPDEALWGFLVAMVWGYGSTGYGPWRVEQMLSSLEQPSVALHRVALSLADEGVLAAYGLLGGEAKMTKLGPAFGTKFLYFCKQPSSGFGALILDKLVSDWLRENAEMRLNPVPWSVKTYSRYLESMHEWAGELSVPAEEVERSIFQAQANSRGGQWASMETD